MILIWDHIVTLADEVYSFQFKLPYTMLIMRCVYQVEYIWRGRKGLREYDFNLLEDCAHYSLVVVLFLMVRSCFSWHMSYGNLGSTLEPVPHTSGIYCQPLWYAKHQLQLLTQLLNLRSIPVNAAYLSPSWTVEVSSHSGI